MPDSKYGRIFTEQDVKELIGWAYAHGRDIGNIEDAGGELDNWIMAAADDGTPMTFPDDEPVFVLRGKDKAAATTIGSYADECEALGSPAAHVSAVQHAGGAMLAWQAQHPEHVKVPD